MPKALLSLLLLTALFLSGCSGTGKATHHFSIYVKPHPQAKDERLSVTGETVRDETKAIVDAWAKANGFQPSTPAQMRTQYSSTAPTLQPLYYRQGAPAADDFCEIIVAFDFGGFPVAVTGSEGYGLVPSSKLESLQKSLQARLTQRFGSDLVTGSIW